MRFHTILPLIALCSACRSGPVIDTAELADLDGDGVLGLDDCNDDDASVYPGAPELCDGIDNNCNSTIDDDPTNASTFYLDGDGDGYGNDGVTTESCDPAAGYVAAGGDCDDSTANINPSATEDDCTDSVDYNCDGSVGYADADADGFPACEDCDDADVGAFPGATETCDTVDNNCDGEIDEVGAVGGDLYYADTDNDGFGDPDSAIFACEGLDGYATNSLDCDDTAAAINPAADELCNSIDDDCTGTADDDAIDAPTWYADLDGDSFGNAAFSQLDCAQPAGFVTDATDCNDLSSAALPTGIEVCDGLDNDCDGGTDDAPVDSFSDTDGDGQGDSASASCDSSAVSNSDDCDDSNALSYLGAPEICDANDNDCNGTADNVVAITVMDGSSVAGKDLQFLFSPIGAGLGSIRANWTSDPAAARYDIAIGTTAGDDDVYPWSDAGTATSANLSGLDLEGAWINQQSYYVSVRSVTAGFTCPATSSDGVQIAELRVWDGDVTKLRPNDAWGGANVNWPQSGASSVYGAHYFEEVEIPADSELMVQGFGAADGVGSNTGANAGAVERPADGWVALWANNITVDGKITASGRGYGGGGGGGGGSGSIAYQGNGGVGGFGGNGANGEGSLSGNGGGASPGGNGGTAGRDGGDGNMWGGGSGSNGAACSGNVGRDGGDGPVDSVGYSGDNATTTVPGVGGAGEFGPGGGDGVRGCDNSTGGGGGGYGGGGGGGSQWQGGGTDAGGGGGGGTGGSGGNHNANGARGAGPYAGGGGIANSSAGEPGGYLTGAGNGDTYDDRRIVLGGGGGGGGAGSQEGGGGGGGAGGGAIFLHAHNDLTVGASAFLLANGAGGGGGAHDNAGTRPGHQGGPGAGGTILVEADNLSFDATFPNVSMRGGDGATDNSGSFKAFYGALSGTLPDASEVGQVLDGGSGSFETGKPAYPEDCKAILAADSSAADGLYWIDPAGAGYFPFEAYCDMTTDGGGWTLVWKNHGGAKGGETSNATLLSWAAAGIGNGAVLPHEDDLRSEISQEAYDTFWDSPNREWIKITTLWDGADVIENQQHIRVDMGTVTMAEVFGAPVSSCVPASDTIAVTVNGSVDFGTTNLINHYATSTFGLANSGNGGADNCGEDPSNLITDPTGDTLYRIDGTGNTENGIRHLFSYNHNATGRDTSRCLYACWDASSYAGHYDGYTWGVR